MLDIDLSYLIFILIALPVNAISTWGTLGHKLSSNITSINRLNDNPFSLPHPMWFEEADWEMLHGTEVSFLDGVIRLQGNKGIAPHAIYDNGTHSMVFIDAAHESEGGEHRYMSRILGDNSVHPNDKGQQFENQSSGQGIITTVYGSEFQRKVGQARQIFGEIDGLFTDLLNSNMIKVATGVTIWWLARRGRAPNQGAVRVDNGPNHARELSLYDRDSCDRPRSGNLDHYDVNDLQLGKCALAARKLDQTYFDFARNSQVLQHLMQSFQGYVQYYNAISVTAYFESVPSNGQGYYPAMQIAWDCYLSSSTDVFVC